MRGAPRAYRSQILRSAAPRAIPEGARLEIVERHHDFGTYYELTVIYD